MKTGQKGKRANGTTNDDSSNIICCEMHRDQLKRFGQLSQVLPSLDVKNLGLHFARHCPHNRKISRTARRLTLFTARSSNSDSKNNESPFDVIDRLLMSPSSFYTSELTGRPFQQIQNREDLLFGFNRYFRSFKIDNFTIMPFGFDVQLRNRPLSFRSKDYVYGRLMSMKNIFIKDTKINRVHKGHRLTLRMVMEPYITPRSVHLIAQDERRTTIRLTIYNWHTLVFDRTIDQIVARLKEKFEIIVGNPFIKLGADNLLLLRVDNPRLEIWFTDYEKILEKSTADQLREFGKIRFEQENFAGAIEYFSLGLEKSPDDTKILDQRGESFLQADSADAALIDTEKVLQIIEQRVDEPPSSGFLWKILFRKIRSLMSLKKYDEARNFAQNLIETKTNENETQKIFLERLQRFIQIDIPALESLANGQYDFKAFLDNSSCFYDELQPDFELKNTFEFRQCEEKEKGFGQFATRRIPCGTLLIVERPFAFVHGQSNEDLAKNDLPLIKFAITQKPQFRYDSESNTTPFRYFREPEIELIQKIEEKFFTDGDRAMEIFGNLLPFRQNRRRDLSEDDQNYKLLPYKVFLEFLERNIISTGLWPKLSRFNHSCLPNCCFLVVRHLCFVQTLRTIEIGEELTISYLPSIYSSYIERTIRLRDFYVEPCSCDLCVYEREIGQMELQQISRLFDEADGNQEKQRYFFKLLIHRYSSTRPLGFVEQTIRMKNRVSTGIFLKQIRHGHLNHRFILNYLQNQLRKYKKIKDCYQLLTVQFPFLDWPKTDSENLNDEQEKRFKENLQILIKILPD